MPFESDFPEPETFVPWDDIQRGLSSEAGLEDVPGFTKEANVGPEMVAVEQDSVYADSGLLNESLEIDRHVKRMTDEEKLAYVVIERSLLQMGYKRPTIRRSFLRVTGIDPVRAYLDAANFPVPPGSVPRYNYGWGVSKEGSADFFFVLPWTDKYAVFKLKGMERELVSDHDLLDEAREALAKKVKGLRDVTPDNADTITEIIQKVAEVKALSDFGAQAMKALQAIAELDPDAAARHLVQAHEEGHLTDSDFRTIAQRVILAAPLSEQTLSPLTAPERVDEKEFQSFREQQEGRSFKEMKQNTVMPGQEFASSWGDRHKVDFWGVLIESRELFNKIVSTIQGFKIEPEWGSFHIMPQPNLAVSDDNHILDGSVGVGATARTADGEKESQIAVLMFIHNGTLRFDGKFKGVNDREYALTTMGLEEYFRDLEGTSALDEQIGMGGGTEFGPQADQPARI